MCIRVDLGPGTFLTQRSSVLTVCAGLITLCGHIFPFQTLYVLFCFAWSIWHLAKPTNPTAIIYCQWGRDRVLHSVAQQVCMPANGPEANRSDHWPWETDALYRSWSCSVSVYVNKMLFHPVPDSSVFSLATQKPRCSGQQCSDCYSWWQATDDTSQ